MNFKQEIENFIPCNEQEKCDKELLMEYIRLFPDTILFRENKIAHITSSGFIFNKKRNKVLMVHHNIFKTWTWTGGHMDGKEDLLGVALKEAKEETGVHHFEALSNEIASLDILTVPGHFKNGTYVSAHLHLSVAYALVADENEELKVRNGENTGVKWIDIEEMEDYSKEAEIIPIYYKIINKANQLK